MRRRILCAITVAVLRACLVAKSCGCGLCRWHRAKLTFHRARINSYQQNALDSDRLSFDRSLSLPMFAPSRPLEVLSRGIAMAGRDAASCGLPMQADPREASGNTALPPLRAERANAPMRDQGHRSCAPPDRLAKAGPEPTTAAVERREASVPAGTQGAQRQRVYARLRRAMRLRAYVTGPPTGAAAPERLSALRSLIVEMRETASLGGLVASREG